MTIRFQKVLRQYVSLTWSVCLVFIYTDLLDPAFAAYSGRSGKLVQCNHVSGSQADIWRSGAFINKIVFKKTWHVSARLSISSNLHCLHNSSCSFKCYSIHCMCQTICDVTSSNFLGRLVQCEQKGWDRGRWVGIYTQRVKTAWLCVGLAVKIPQQGDCTVISPHRASMQCSKCDLLARAG